VSNTKLNIAAKKQELSFVNPFIQMMNDKKMIDQITQDGKPLSALKGIKFVKPL
jgi:hypothetical protein